MIELSMQIASASVSVAGDSLNTAIYLKRSAPEIDVDYITQLGDDTFSVRIRDFIAAEGIGTDRISTEVGGLPGLYAIALDENGERSFTYWRSNSAARRIFADGDFSRLEGYDLIYLSGISMAILSPETRERLVDYLKSCGIPIAYDSNHRPALWNSPEDAQAINSELWGFAAIPLPSVDDEMKLFGETAKQVKARCSNFSGIGALKCGAEGPHSIGEEVNQAYPEVAKIVDTTAAGDSFNGGYLAAKLTGSSQADALMAGHLLASRVIQTRGAIIRR